MAGRVLSDAAGSTLLPRGAQETSLGDAHSRTGLDTLPTRPRAGRGLGVSRPVQGPLFFFSGVHDPTGCQTGLALRPCVGPELGLARVCGAGPGHRKYASSLGHGQPFCFWVWRGGTGGSSAGISTGSSAASSAGSSDGSCSGSSDGSSTGSRNVPSAGSSAGSSPASSAGPSAGQCWVQSWIQYWIQYWIQCWIQYWIQ